MPKGLLRRPQQVPTRLAGVWFASSCRESRRDPLSSGWALGGMASLYVRRAFSSRALGRAPTRAERRVAAPKTPSAKNAQRECCRISPPPPSTSLLYFVHLLKKGGRVFHRLEKKATTTSCVIRCCQGIDFVILVGCILWGKSGKSGEQHSYFFFSSARRHESLIYAGFWAIDLHYQLVQKKGADRGPSSGTA